MHTKLARSALDVYAVSSEAMLGGQKSPYKLLVRAVNQHTGAEVPYITFVASEDFVVRSASCKPPADVSLPFLNEIKIGYAWACLQILFAPDVVA